MLQITRRQAILKVLATAASLSLLSACERHRYIRPVEELELGEVKNLLFTRTHSRKRAVLLFRDAEGWSALSARCTYRGCDLTYQDPYLLCPCCQTRYTLEGIPLPGSPATHPLPWLDVYYRDGFLYASAQKLHDKSWRFTTPNIEEAIRELRLRTKEMGGEDVEIPEILKGKGDGEPGQMFIEEDERAIVDRQQFR